MSVRAGRSTGKSASDPCIPLGYAAAQEWQLGQDLRTSAVPSTIGRTTARLQLPTVTTSATLSIVWARHHFLDVLTHGQAALLFKTGDRYAVQAVPKVPTVLEL